MNKEELIMIALQYGLETDGMTRASLLTALYALPPTSKKIMHLELAEKPKCSICKSKTLEMFNMVDQTMSMICPKCTCPDPQKPNIIIDDVKEGDCGDSSSSKHPSRKRASVNPLSESEEEL